MPLVIVCFVFFCSGISALLFETLWLRLAGLAFGNAVVSVTLILSSFMTGLALGAAVAAKGTFSKYRPLKIYALLELSVAVLGLGVVLLLPNAALWLRPVFHVLSGQPFASEIFKFVTAFALLVTPAMTMGLTLPIAISDRLFDQHHFRRALALFYGSNTVGAVVGSLLAEAWLVRWCGMLGAAVCAAGLNFVAAAVAWVLVHADGPVRSPIAAPTQKLLAPNSKPAMRFLVISFATGALLLSLEVIWFRFLRLYVASSATAFGVMLAVVLAGIALGSLVAAIFRPTDPQKGLTNLPLLLLAAANTTLLAYAFFPMSILQRTAASWQDYMLDRWTEVGILSLALMFPTAFVSGMLFPATVAAIQSVIPSRIQSVGLATLLNTVGAGVAPLVTSFVLLPLAGFQTTLIICATTYAALAVITLPTARANIGTIAFAALFVATLIFFPYRRGREHFAHARAPFEADGAHLVTLREGNSDTWQLLRRDLYGQPYYCRLLTNAFSMSSTQYPNQRYMRLFAYLPLTLQSQARNALLICYGCGVTADALTQDRQLQRIDVVDLSKEVLDLASYYPGANPLRDPRVNTFVQDGRFFLQETSRKYDIITGEPPPPKVAGTVNIYTQEFFKLMHDALNDGGIATFWLPIYQLNVDETKAILRGFHNAFPNASVWASADDEWIMMGIKGSTTKLDRQQTARLWQTDTTRADLLRIGFEQPEQLGALFVMDADGIDRLTADTPPLSDAYPKRLTDDRVDLGAVHDFSLPYMDAEPATRRFRASQFVSAIWPNDFRTAVAPFFVIREIRYRSRINGSNRFAELDYYLRSSKLRMPVLEVLGSDEYRVALARKSSDVTSALPDLVADALASRDMPRAVGLLEDERSRNIATRNDLLLLIYLRCLNGDVDLAEQIAQTAETSIGRDWLVEWLFGKLRAESGFRPPF